jgi:hypothetical protein
MDASLLWRAALGQLLAVAALFGLLLVLPLSEDFFRENGAVIGPMSWMFASLLAGRVLSLDAGTILLAAVGSGAAAGLLGVLVDHTVGLVVGVGAYGVIAASRRTERLDRGASAAAAR